MHIGKLSISMLTVQLCRSMNTIQLSTSMLTVQLCRSMQPFRRMHIVQLCRGMHTVQMCRRMHTVQLCRSPRNRLRRCLRRIRWNPSQVFARRKVKLGPVLLLICSVQLKLFEKEKDSPFSKLKIERYFQRQLLKLTLLIQI